MRRMSTSTRRGNAPFPMLLLSLSSFAIKVNEQRATWLFGFPPNLVVGIPISWDRGIPILVVRGPVCALRSRQSRTICRRF